MRISSSSMTSSPRTMTMRVWMLCIPRNGRDRRMMRMLKMGRGMRAHPRQLLLRRLLAFSSRVTRYSSPSTQRRLSQVRLLPRHITLRTPASNRSLTRTRLLNTLRLNTRTKATLSLSTSINTRTHTSPLRLSPTPAPQVSAQRSIIPLRLGPSPCL